MNRIENEFYFENKIIKYLFQESKQDRRHLVVVFSGFGSNRSVEYDFTGEPAASCRSNILWIKDDINDECTYYLCNSLDFGVENAVISLITSTMERLNITRNMCTLMGFSKGGSAAIYYGIKYNFENIISSCPQFHVGSYALKNWPQVASNMFGSNIVDEDVVLIDSLIPNLLKNDTNKCKNIYLLSSPNDEQFPYEIEPYLSHFFKYENFSFIFTQSSLAWQHNKVTRYNLPIILSILYAHGEGIYPAFGQVKNGIDHNKDVHAEKLSQQYQKKGQGIAHITGLKIQDSVIYPQGVAFIKGIECSKYEDIKHTLILHNDKDTFEYPLGKVLDKEINYRYYEQCYYDYSAAAFTSIAHKGINIRDLPVGRYNLSARIFTQEKTIVLPLTSQKEISSSTINENNLIHFKSSSSEATINISPTISCNEQITFEVKNKWLKDNYLHYEGIFLIKGVELREWGDATYLLVLKSESDCFTFKLGMRDKPELNFLYQEDIGIYQKSYFCSLGGQGVAVSDLPRGIYSAFISMIFNGHTYTQCTGDVVDLSE